MENREYFLCQKYVEIQSSSYPLIDALKSTMRLVVLCVIFRKYSVCERQKLDSPSLSISNTLMASCGVRFLNSLAGSVCRLCRRGLTTLTGVFRKKGLRNGEPLTCCVMMPQHYKTGGSEYFSEIYCLSVCLLLFQPLYFLT